MHDLFSGLPDGNFRGTTWNADNLMITAGKFTDPDDAHQTTMIAIEYDGQSFIYVEDHFLALADADGVKKSHDLRPVEL